MTRGADAKGSKRPCGGAVSFLGQRRRVDTLGPDRTFARLVTAVAKLPQTGHSRSRRARSRQLMSAVPGMPAIARIRSGGGLFLRCQFAIVIAQPRRNRSRY